MSNEAPAAMSPEMQNTVLREKLKVVAKQLGDALDREANALTDLALTQRAAKTAHVELTAEMETLRTQIAAIVAATPVKRTRKQAIS